MPPFPDGASPEKEGGGTLSWSSEIFHSTLACAHFDNFIPAVSRAADYLGPIYFNPDKWFIPECYSNFIVTLVHRSHTPSYDLILVF